MKIDWDSFRERVEGQEDSNRGQNRTRVQFFSLRNDGDEAIVRIMHDSPQDFDLCAVHKVQLDDGKFRSVSCLRNPTDPIDMCPLCANGEKVEMKIYIHLLEYVKQDNGTITPIAKVWERRADAYGKRLVGLMNEYGPLSETIFKIKRHGAAGSTKTDYDILPMSPNVYPPTLYIKDTSLFSGYTALGHAVLDKTYEEMLRGDFSFKSSNTEQPKEPVYSERKVVTEPTYSPTRAQVVPDKSSEDLPWENIPESKPAQPSPTYTQTTYGSTSQNNGQRPRRTYFN